MTSAAHLNPDTIVSERVGVHDGRHWVAAHYERDGAWRQATIKAAVGCGYLQRAVVEEAGVGRFKHTAAAAATELVVTPCLHQIGHH